MVNFVNKIELSDQKYQLNVVLGYEDNKGKFLFPIRDFESFRTYCRSM